MLHLPAPLFPEEYLTKERECLGARSLLAQVLSRNAQVRGGEERGWGSQWGWGMPELLTHSTRCWSCC